MDSKIYELRDLKEGTIFEVVGLENNYRKLTLVGLTAGAALVKGESSLDDSEIDDNGNKNQIWKALSVGTVFSLKTPVRIK